MAAHSSIPAWRIAWTGEPGGLQSVGSHRVRHDWANEPHWLRRCLRTGPVDKKFFESQPITRSLWSYDLLCPKAGPRPGILRRPRILNLLPGGPAAAPLSVSLECWPWFLEGLLLRWEPSPAPPLGPQTCQAGFQSLLTRGWGAGHPSINAEAQTIGNMRWIAWINRQEVSKTCFFFGKFPHRPPGGMQKQHGWWVRKLCCFPVKVTNSFAGDRTYSPRLLSSTTGLTLGSVSALPPHPATLCTPLSLSFF